MLLKTVLLLYVALFAVSLFLDQGGRTLLLN